MQDAAIPHFAFPWAGALSTHVPYISTLIRSTYNLMRQLIPNVVPQSFNLYLSNSDAEAVANQLS